jgi:hypothetical protein
LANALSVTAPAGEINCLDDGSYGTVTVNQSLRIDCSGHLGAIDFTSGVGAVFISQPNIVVTLRNLRINGHGASTSGVYAQFGGSLVIEHCVTQNFSRQNGIGINVVPTQFLQLRVLDTLIDKSGLFGLNIANARRAHRFCCRACPDRKYESAEHG